MGIRVLIVEDEGLVALELSHRLARAGYHVIGAAGSAARALALAASEPRIDLLLVDIRLGDGPDGIALSRELRARIDAPVVFLTAHADERTVARMREVAPDGYVLKPFDERVLLITLEHAVLRHRAERGRREAEALASTLFQHAPDAILAIAEDDVVVRANHAARELFGADLSGVTIHELIDVSDARDGSLASQLARARDGDRACFVGLATRPGATGRGDARVRQGPAALTLTAVPGTRQVVATARDLRTLRQLEDRLVNALKMAAVGRLVASVAHDFSNVLMAAGLSAWVARQHLAATPGVAALDTIDVAIQHGDALARQLLAMVRADGGVHGSCDGTWVTRHLEAVLRRLCGSRVAMRLRALDAAPVAIGRGHLEQVLINLVVNARDAMPDGGMVDVSWKPETREDEPGFVLTVTDQGCGVPPELADRIFEPLVSTKGDGGTGIGLAVTKAIAEAVGGTIRLSLGPGGEGSRFAVWLPASRAAVEEERAPERAPLSAPRRAGPVLVVSPNDQLRRAVVLALAELGIPCLEAASAGLALNAAERRGVVVEGCLLEDDLGSVGPLELLNILRRSWPALKAVVISDEARDEPQTAWVPRLHHVADLLGAVIAMLGVEGRE